MSLPPISPINPPRSPDPTPLAGERRPATSLGLARLMRLTRKELKETLRDRRTILTLVLMPLLVYPLLSLGLRQFLLSGSHASAAVRWNFGAESHDEFKLLSLMLQSGEASLAIQPGDQRIENIDTTVLAGGLEAAVRDHKIDLGVRVRPRQPKGTKLDEKTAARGADVELIYRPEAPISTAALDYVERRLRAFNDNYVHTRLQALGDPGDLPASWKPQPVVSEDRQSGGLATLVPLVLILMTITGAVYPAIDLTAGERERGTLEALMAAPLPRLAVLFAKYVAVVTVALLTALVNLLAMTITIATTGVGPQVFGEQGLTVGGVAVVFLLLVLFAAFFSAVLLCLTSFARSFKEAQAYLIPLMLVALGPGFLSLVPGVHLGPVLAITPLANIVLLARDVMAGNASPLWAAVAILTTILYGAFALAMAARIFGSDAILYGSQNSWGDLFRRPSQPLPQPTPAGALATLAIVGPLFVVSSGALALMQAGRMEVQLLAGAGMLLLLFLVVPLYAARWQGVAIRSGFQLRRPRILSLLGAIVLGLSLAPLAYELIIVSQDLGIATITDEQLKEKQPAVDALVARWRTMSPALVLIALALVPAIAEEFFFRGYLLGALRGRLPAWSAILLTGVVFGLFHASVGGIVAVERVLSSAALGIVLGWVCWTSRSVLPGMLLHALNNGLLLALVYWGDGLKSLGLDVEGQRHLPAMWLAGATGLSAIGLALVWLGRRK